MGGALDSLCSRINPVDDAAIGVSTLINFLYAFILCVHSFDALNCSEDFIMHNT